MLSFWTRNSQRAVAVFIQHFRTLNPDRCCRCSRCLFLCSVKHLISWQNHWRFASEHGLACTWCFHIFKRAALRHTHTHQRLRHVCHFAILFHHLCHMCISIRVTMFGCVCVCVTVCAHADTGYNVASFLGQLYFLTFSLRLLFFINVFDPKPVKCCHCN